MLSERFGKSIVITSHARERMAARAIDEALLLDIIETGETRYKDKTRLWIAKHYGDRADNLLCLAVTGNDIGDQNRDASLFVGV